MPTSLWLIRHGETDWNAVGRVQGQLDIPLNAVGLRQAERLAQRLANDHLRQPFKALFSSDLLRASATAAAAAERLSLPVEQRVGLRERHYGVLSALTPVQMEATHPEAFSRWKSRDPDYEVPGGESLCAFSARVLRELTDIARVHPDAQVLVVAHGGVLDCAYRAATQKPLQAKRTHALHNVSINRVRVDEHGALSVEAWGDVAHLDDQSLDDA
jgi:2,3-bisphosphoglycerate-dependent phosphoglycerate mutase